jgi:DNA-directed RNA polymerase specialized sigma24 family protein
VLAVWGRYEGLGWLPVPRVLADDPLLEERAAWQRRSELRRADLAEWESEFGERGTDDAHGLRPGDGWATRELVGKLLRRLQTEDRRVIGLFELERRTILEICAETGWNFEWMKMRLFRARRNFGSVAWNCRRRR